MLLKTIKSNWKRQLMKRNKKKPREKKSLKIQRGLMMNNRKLLKNQKGEEKWQRKKSNF